MELIHNIAHLTRAYELRLFHVNHSAGFRHRFHQVGLARQKRRELNHVNHISNRLRLAGFMDVSDHFYAKCLLEFLEDFHPFFQTRPTVRVNRGTVGFIKRGLEHVRNTQLLGNGYVVLTNAHCQIA
ncbi:Uncharacterised protein [Salmonella enterica subsp. enterica serovar Typhimurium str. DT104]|nr:Uncharacterised protein [Salmonella enterica subsp. enterica serovar Typhimurium str. DT104]